MVAEFLGSARPGHRPVDPAGSARIAIIMLGAIATVHRQPGFFMNWSAPARWGVEYHLLALGLATALVIGGAGRWSLDALVTGWR